MLRIREHTISVLIPFLLPISIRLVHRSTEARSSPDFAFAGRLTGRAGHGCCRRERTPRCSATSTNWPHTPSCYESTDLRPRNAFSWNPFGQRVEIGADAARCPERVRSRRCFHHFGGASGPAHHPLTERILLVSVNRSTSLPRAGLDSFDGLPLPTIALNGRAHAPDPESEQPAQSHPHRAQLSLVHGDVRRRSPPAQCELGQVALP